VTAVVRLTEERRADTLRVLSGSEEERGAVESLVIAVHGVAVEHNYGLYHLPTGALSYVEAILRGGGVVVEKGRP